MLIEGQLILLTLEMQKCLPSDDWEGKPSRKLSTGEQESSLWPQDTKGFQNDTVAKNPPANAGDAGDSGSISGSGRSPRVGNGNPLRYSCLGNSKDRGAWRAAVHWESQRVRHE